jgi:hypothetical protein
MEAHEFSLDQTISNTLQVALCQSSRISPTCMRELNCRVLRDNGKLFVPKPITDFTRHNLPDVPSKQSHSRL